MSQQGHSYLRLFTTLAKKDLQALKSGRDETENNGFEMKETMVEEFLQLSGDPNPIHRRDTCLAGGKVLVPGLLLGWILANTYLPEITHYRLDFRFHLPVFTGDKVALAAVKPDVFGIYRGNDFCTEMRLT